MALHRHTALVTGATGFIGSHLAARLLDEGCEVHAITRATSDASRLPQTTRVHIHDGSPESMRAIVHVIKPDVAYHLAALFLASHRPEDIPHLIRSNIEFGAQLLDALVYAGSARLVNTATSWQHYDGDTYCPANLYAASRQAFECLARYYIECGNVRMLTLTLFDTYGPGDPRRKLVPLLCKTIRTGEPLSMSPGEQLIDLVYVDDVVEAFFLAGQRLLNPPSHVGNDDHFKVSSGSALSLRELVRRLEAIVGRKLPIEFGGRTYRFREVMVPWRGGTPLPGWSPRIPLADGLARTIATEKGQMR